MGGVPQTIHIITSQVFYNYRNTVPQHHIVSSDCSNKIYTCDEKHAHDNYFKYCSALLSSQYIINSTVELRVLLGSYRREIKLFFMYVRVFTGMTGYKATVTFMYISLKI